MIYTYPERAFARYYRFWPTLRRPASDIGQNIITNEGGRLFSLNIRLYLDTHTLFNFHSGFDGIDRSPNFTPNNIPAASGGQAGSANPFTFFERTGQSRTSSADIPDPITPNVTVDQI